MEEQMGDIARFDVSPHFTDELRVARVIIERLGAVFFRPQGIIDHRRLSFS
jgi:hypothetical protein